MFDKLKLSVKLRVQESANQLAANASISRQIWVHTVDVFINEYIYGRQLNAQHLLRVLS